jgi:adenosylhomocysteine nucleosidase
VEPPPIALVVALSQERRALQRVLCSPRRARVEDFPLFRGELAGRPVLLIQAGIGRERAGRALLAASRRFSFRAAWSVGFAGGLVDGLGPGDLVVPSVVLDDDRLAGRPVASASGQEAVRAALAAAGIVSHGGSLLTVDAPLRTPETKRAAHGRAGAVAVDMEAAGVAEAAETLGIPWLAIKAVVDPVDEALPGFLSGCTTCRGDLRWRGVLWSLALGSRRQTLRRLARASRLAALALRRGLEAAVPAWSP